VVVRFSVFGSDAAGFVLVVAVAVLAAAVDVLTEGSLEEVVVVGVKTLPAVVAAERKEVGEDAIVDSLSSFLSSLKTCLQSPL
jgi:hypothetical protein